MTATRRIFVIATTLLLIALHAFGQTNIAGRWQTMGVPNGPWVIDFQVNGAQVTGTVRQGGPTGEPVPIYFGSIEGNSVRFKANSPDGDRIITFTGKITSAEIGFARAVEVRPGGTRGDTGIFGGNAVSYFAARRAAQ
jgi:hypothetical protein